MATGHLNPGYGNIVSDFRRTKPASYPGTLPSGQMLRDYLNRSRPRENLEAIRSHAREAWSRPQTSETSYQDHYQYDQHEILEYTQPRPTSATRRNKPHPPQVFLNCRLHTVPGFYNPDATLGKDTYRVDEMTGGQEQNRRFQLRAKFAAGPSSAALNQYSDLSEEGDHYIDSREKFGRQAVRKLNGGRDSVSREVMNIDFDDVYRPDSGQSEHNGRLLYDPEVDMVPSLHRYLKPSGAYEKAKIQERFGSSHAHRRPKTAVAIGTMRANDIDRMMSAQPRYVNPTKRGDFSIHPEWKPHIRHHRLNGLSSVDIPYSFGRR